MTDTSKPFFLQALDALKLGDRRGAASLLERQLRGGNTAAKNLPSVSQLAAHIGEIDLAIEASRRAVVPGSLETLLDYWATLASYGRSQQAVAEAERLPGVKDHPSALHFRGTAATQFGRFDEAQELFRNALAKQPAIAATWLSLAMIKTFSSGDPDVASMEKLERQSTGQPDARAILCYALGKAWDDCGDPTRAFDYYSRGAALCRLRSGFDPAQFGAAADEVIRSFTPENLARLKRSGFDRQRSLFVTGLPRSGTTVTEQILRGHSGVRDGDELNLFNAALIPTMGIGAANALAYQERSDYLDPWGEIGRDYGHFIDMRFRSPGLVVDKSLGQSLTTGLMLHALPQARVAWLRRSPEDVALSCFRTYFSTGLPWTWSLTDIADHMRAEDRLFEHWRTLFADRILVVPYEDLVRSPAAWAEKLQQHFGLPIEEAIESRSKADRAISSASVSQARKPISASRIGQAAAFEPFLKPFRDRYYV